MGTFQEVFQIFKGIFFLEHPYLGAATHLLKDVSLGIKQWGRKKQNNIPIFKVFFSRESPVQVCSDIKAFLSTGFFKHSNFNSFAKVTHAWPKKS